MSVKAMTFVFDHSPFTLATRLVHLAVADIANEDNDWLVWVTQKKIAVKAKVSVPTVSAALKTMVERGYLKLVGVNSVGTVTYRFLTPNPSESEHPKSEAATPQNDTAEPPKSTDPHYLPTQVELKENSSLVASSEATPVARLCAFLSRGIGYYRGDPVKAPRHDTESFHTSMRLLLERGPTTWGTPAPIPEQDIHDVIAYVFTKLNQPDGGSTFCWAGVIESPSSLRKHWDKLVAACQFTHRTSGDPLDRIAAKLQAERDQAVGELE